MGGSPQRTDTWLNVYVRDGFFSLHPEEEPKLYKWLNDLDTPEVLGFRNMDGTTLYLVKKTVEGWKLTTPASRLTNREMEELVNKENESW